MVPNVNQRTGLYETVRCLAVCKGAIFYVVGQQTYRTPKQALAGLEDTQAELIEDGLDLDLYILERAQCEAL